MSYYILPKNFNNISINISFTNEKIQLYTSHSVYNYYNTSLKQLINICLINNETTFECISKIINTYDELSIISKIKNKPPIFYELFEIIRVLYIYDTYEFIPINLYIASYDKMSVIECISFFRQNCNDTFISSKEYEFIYYELNCESYKDTNNYIYEFITILIKILKCQKIGGTSIIKIHNLFYKPIIDIIYLITSFFEKVIIIKPTISNISTYEKYIVCKGFISSPNLNTYYQDLSFFIENYNKIQNVQSIINFNIPYFFLNKINDINITLGQYQLETIQQFINILKNKSKIDKLDILKNNNKQKCIQWCEKYKI